MRRKGSIEATGAGAVSLLNRLIPRLPARRREDLDVLFQRGEQGFSGADGDSSLLLDPHRSLWLFGDTLVGPRNHGALLGMPRNAVGILALKRKPQRFTFYWREKDGELSDFFPSSRPGEWLWPGSACAVNERLYFFLHGFRTDNTKRIEAFRFRYAGFRVLCAENLQESPDRWILRPVAMPRLAVSVFWGIACFSAPDGYVYLWGWARGNRRRGTVVARYPADQLGPGGVTSWEYYCEGKPQPAWRREGRHLKPLFPDSSPEMSLSYLSRQKVFVAVYSRPRTSRVGLRVARQLMGPWSPYQVIYDPPERRWHKRYFCYAPKAHPELSPKGDELPITYITNAYEVKHVFNDHRIYYPKFISVPLTDIGKEK